MDKGDQNLAGAHHVHFMQAGLCVELGFLDFQDQFRPVVHRLRIRQDDGAG